MILGQHFPECLKPDQYHKRSPDYFEPVGEHMYKNVQELAGYELGIDTTHPRNGLLIVKSLQKMFQEAHMVLVPTMSEEDVSETDCPGSGHSPTEQKLEIIIAKEFLGQDVLWIDKTSHTTAPFQATEAAEQRKKHQGTAACAAHPVRRFARESTHDPEALHVKSLHASDLCQPPTFRDSSPG